MLICKLAALAALAAEERPRASMIAAPRLPTVGMNVDLVHSSSLTSFVTESPFEVANLKSGIIVGL